MRKEKTIKVEWEVNTETGNESFDLSDLNCESLDAWNSLTNDKKEGRIQEALDSLPQRTFIALSSYEHFEK